MKIVWWWASFSIWDAWDDTTLMTFKGSRHGVTLIGEGLGDRRRVRRLGINAGLWRSSLRIVVQSDVVFIMSYNVHGPWNIVEGHGRMMAKGYEVSEECHLMLHTLRPSWYSFSFFFLCHSLPLFSWPFTLHCASQAVLWYEAMDLLSPLYIYHH